MCCFIVFFFLRSSSFKPENSNRTYTTASREYSFRFATVPIFFPFFKIGVKILQAVLAIAVDFYENLSGPFALKYAELKSIDSKELFKGLYPMKVFIIE